jgi:hypothetical protein
MPRGNGAGPNGSGPMTGRGAGYCGAPGNGKGQGLGAGRRNGARCFDAGGTGRGFRDGRFFGMSGTPDVDNQASFLKSRIKMLSEALEAAQNTLTELKDEPEAKYR